MEPEKDIHKIKSRVLREVMDEIIREKRKRTSFPHWMNWMNWMNWRNWMNWWT